MNPLLQRISVDPNVCFGKPCIRGTRVTVGTIAGLGLFVFVFLFGLPPGGPPGVVIGMILAVITALAFRGARRQPWLIAGWLWWQLRRICPGPL